MLIVDNVIQVGTVWHKRSPASTNLQIGVVQDAIDGLWFRVNPRNQDNVVPTTPKIHIVVLSDATINLGRSSGVYDLMYALVLVNRLVTNLTEAS